MWVHSHTAPGRQRLRRVLIARRGHRPDTTVCRKKIVLFIPLSTEKESITLRIDEPIHDCIYLIASNIVRSNSRNT